MLQAKKKMVRLVEKVIAEKRKRGGDRIARDIIDVLIKDASDQLTDDLISDNMIDLMIPGEDSVPMLVTLAIKYLSDCPPALQHLEVILKCQTCLSVVGCANCLSQWLFSVRRVSWVSD